MTFVLKKSEYDVVGLINSCNELHNALKSDFGQDCLEFHVQGNKNDFADWITKELNKPKLGQKVRAIVSDYVDNVLLKKIIELLEHCDDS